jgi:cytochrome d ubiquinol oxidase subunit II
MLLLFMLIFRAVAIEFRSKRPMAWWRSLWDGAFSLSSFLIAFLMGVSLGNIISGVPLGPDKEFVGTTLGLVTPYTIMVGLTTVALFMMHGAIYGVMKTEGQLHERLRAWVNRAIIGFVICYATTTMATLIYHPHMIAHFKQTPLLFVVAVLNMLAIANIPREISKGRDFPAFMSSCAAIAALMFLFAMGVFPNIVISNPNPEYSLTIYNAASSARTLKIMATIAAIGIPFVLAYTVCIYWIFRGKVKLDAMSY